MFNGYYPQYTPPMPALATSQISRVTRVSGRPGAEAFQMAPNSEFLLLDETQPVVWLKTTDGAGYPRLTAYDITVHEDEKPIDYKSFDERLRKLEDIINAKSDPVAAP